MADLSQLEQQFGLPAGLLSAVQNAESGGNSKAVSSKGALGLFQFLPATAEDYGIDPLDPDQAAQGAAHMYGDLLKKYDGDVPSALAAYNWGQGNVDRKGLQNAPPETQNYINKVMANIGGQPQPSALSQIANSVGNFIMPSANAAEANSVQPATARDLQSTVLNNTPDDQATSLSQANPDGSRTTTNYGPAYTQIDPLSAGNISDLFPAKSPDLSHLSDEKLQKLAEGGSAPDLSHLSDAQLEQLASQPDQHASQLAANGITSSPNSANGPPDGNKVNQSALAGLRQLSAGDPNTDYGNILPFSRNTKTGETSFDLTAPLHGMGAALANWFDPEMQAQTSRTEEGGQGPSLTDLVGLGGVSPVSRAGLPSSGSALRGLTNNSVVGDVLDQMALKKAEVPVVAKVAQVAASKDVPTTSQEFHQLAQQAYQQADEKGGVLTPEFTNKFIDEAKSVAPQTEAGKAIAGDSVATKLVDRMQSLKDKPITLAGAQEIDESLGGLIDKEYGLKGLSKEGKQIYDLQTKFREMMNDAVKSGDVAGGAEGFEAWKQGQQYWAQTMAMRDVERILNRANQMTVPATGIKTGMRTLANNPTRMRGFAPTEKVAINNAAKTGALTGLMNIFGSRLIPIAAATAEGVGGGGITGGLIAGTVAHGLSSGARNIATRLQTNRANKVLQEIAKRPAKGK